MLGHNRRVRRGIESGVVEIRPTRGLRGFSLSELARHWEVAAWLALRDLKLRYRQTAFGSAWAVLQPVTAAATFTLFFGHLAHVASDGLPYASFALAGAVCWTYVSSAVADAANSLVADRALVTKVYFPRILAPTAATLPGLVDFSVAMVVLGVAMAIQRVGPGLAVLLTPIWVLSFLLIAIAIGVWLAALNVKYRDVRYALPFAIQLWLFASPVIYSASYVSGAWRYLYAINPLVGALKGFRWSVMSGPIPGPEVFVSFASLLLIFVVGTAYFVTVQREMADVI
jgi:lipopolysaccharide transport system permease protein